MDQPALPLLTDPQGATTQRRGDAAGAPRLGANGGRIGRPPGARSKASLDLGKYIEARFGGMTPGQQLAELCLVTPRELKAARGDMMMAMAQKAIDLAKELKCEARDAFLLMDKARGELMPYVHARMAPKTDDKAKPPATVFLIPEGEAGAQQLADFSALDDDDIEFVEQSQDQAGQVGQPKSDDTP